MTGFIVTTTNCCNSSCSLLVIELNDLKQNPALLFRQSGNAMILVIGPRRATLQQHKAILVQLALGYLRPYQVVACHHPLGLQLQGALPRGPTSSRQRDGGSQHAILPRDSRPSIFHHSRRLRAVNRACHSQPGDVCLQKGIPASPMIDIPVPRANTARIRFCCLPRHISTCLQQRYHFRGCVSSTTPLLVCFVQSTSNWREHG